MKGSEFPLERTNGHLTELGSRAAQRPVVYRHVESPSVEAEASPGYDSLLDYWHILLRHRRTLAMCAVAGVFAAILISLMQTRVYRHRPSLALQCTHLLLTQGSADSSESA